MNIFPRDALKIYQTDYNKVRIGNEGAGGFVILDLLKYDVLISCGVASDDTFEQIFLNRYNDIKGFLFAGNIKPLPYTSKRTVFKLLDIGKYDTLTTTNLHGLIEQYSDIFLKMTIKGAEFEWFNTLSSSQISKFKQIVVEFNMNNEKYSIQEKRQTLLKLAKTHYLVHLHGNNNHNITLHKSETTEYLNIGSSKYPTKIIKLNKYYDKSTIVVLSPNTFEDAFDFEINGQFLIIRRVDKIAGWGYNHNCVINGQYIPEVFECTYVRRTEINNENIRLSSESIPSNLDMPHNPTKLDIRLFGPPYSFLEPNSWYDDLYKRDGSFTNDGGDNDDQYCQYISDFIQDHPEISRVLDYGCGDWRVGNKINWHQAKVYAYDVSSVIIEKNKIKYPEIDFNECTEEVDLVLIRMVLQYLSFNDIHQILNCLPKSKYYLITDLQPSSLSYHNIDKLSDNSIRNSGLYLESAPFNQLVINKLSYVIGDHLSRTVQYIPYRFPFFKGVNLTEKEQLSRGKPRYYLLEALKMLKKGGTIVEIGTARMQLNHKITEFSPQNHCCNDGHSTYMWTHYHKSGPIYSVDIAESNIQMLKTTIDHPNFHAICEDGIKFLREFDHGKIDLLFLDAWDVLPGIPFAEKHLEAYLVVKDKLSENCLILIDDTDVGDGGKGKLLIPELLKDGYQLLFRGRQTLLAKNVPVRKFDVIISYVSNEETKLCIESIQKYAPVSNIFYLNNKDEIMTFDQNSVLTRNTKQFSFQQLNTLINGDSACDLLILHLNVIFEREVKFYEDDGKICISNINYMLLSKQILEKMFVDRKLLMKNIYNIKNIHDFNTLYLKYATKTFPELISIKTHNND